MTPSGYLTIPEVLSIIRGRIDEDDMLMQRNPKPDKSAVACASLAAAISGGKVSIYTIRGGSVTEISGLFSMRETETHELIDGWETWLSGGRVDNGGKYNGCRLFMLPYDLDRWLGAAPEPVKTGAPGRPTSMPVVIEEFNRRWDNGETASSRAAEAKALAGWLGETHPTFPQLEAKTIQNNLPGDFQPRGGSRNN